MTKVLIIEDDASILIEVSEYLGLVGYDVETASHGLEGLKKAIQYKPDVIVSDVMMPELDGYGVLLELRSNPETADIPFIFLTARVEKQDYRYAIQLGADDYLSKPFTFAELDAAIQSRLERKQLQQAKHAEEMAIIREKLETQRLENEFNAELLSMISHDLKTPLATILTSASLLKDYDHKLDRARKQKHLNRIMQAIQQSTDMLEDLMVFGKFKSGLVNLNLTYVNICEILNQVIPFLWDQDDPTHDLQICHKDLTTQYVEVDEKILKHALLNLLSNAKKYSPPQTVIQVELKTMGQLLEISVTDHGIGIPAKDQQRIFESFQRASNVNKISGTGLGLAVVKLAADLHAGKVECFSQENMGSTFTLSIPVNRLNC